MAEPVAGPGTGGCPARTSVRRDYTLDDVRRSYTPEKRWGDLEGDLPSFLLYRPLSIWLTPLFLKAGCSANLVTAFGLGLALLMPLAALSLGPSAYVAVALLALVVHLLDCVDGNIARTTGRSSRVGALFDGFCDLVFWVLYFAALGLLVERAASGPAGQYGLELSLALVILVLLHRQLRDAYALEYAERGDFRPYPPPRLGPRDLLWIAFIGLERFYAFGILLAGALGALEQLLLAIGVYVVLIFVGAVVLVFSQAIARDRAG
jgi:phosphatidylglycerophosphate synthase